MQLPSSLLALALYCSAVIGAALPIDEDIVDTNSTLAERATKPPTSYSCGGRWGTNPDRPTLISYEIEAWYSGTGSGQICGEPGPGTCHRIWCRNGKRFGFCNDNRFRKCVDKEDIKQRLLWTQSCESSAGFGQTFYPDNTNVIIQAC